MKIRLAAVLAAALSAAFPGGASAHTPSNPEAVGNIARLSGAANLIFRGKVVRVQYRNGPGGANGSPGIPYTFVTYAISAVLQGSSPGPRITLRFIGGPDGRGGFIEAEGVPQFEVGDEDILFVTGNGEVGCPLVMCEFGRFRILDNVVHEAHGTPVVSLQGGRARAAGQAPAAFRSFRYPAPEFDQLLNRPEFSEAIRRSGLTVAQARARYEAETDGTVEVRTVEFPSEEAARISAAAPPAIPVEPFLSAIRSATAQSARRSFTVVESIQPDAPIAAPSPLASAPPALPAGSADSLSPGRIIRKN